MEDFSLRSLKSVTQPSEDVGMWLARLEILAAVLSLYGIAARLPWAYRLGKLITLSWLKFLHRSGRTLWTFTPAPRSRRAVLFAAGIHSSSRGKTGGWAVAIFSKARPTGTLGFLKEHGSDSNPRGLPPTGSLPHCLPFFSYIFQPGGGWLCDVFSTLKIQLCFSLGWTTAELKQ